MENRERKLQRPQEQRLSPRTQLRPWQREPRHDVRRHEPCGLRLPHALRLPRKLVDQGARGQARPQALLRTYPNDHRLSRLPLMGNPNDNPHQLQAASRNRSATLPIKSKREGFRIADVRPGLLTFSTAIFALGAITK